MNKGLKRIIDLYRGQIRLDSHPNPSCDQITDFFNTIDYIVADGDISLVAFNLDHQYHNHLELYVKKDLTDIKSIGMGPVLNMADYYKRLSDLLIFEKRNREANADLISRILTSAKRFQSENKTPVNAIEFLGLNLNKPFPIALNLNKPVHVIYYGKNKQFADNK